MGTEAVEAARVKDGQNQCLHHDSGTPLPIYWLCLDVCVYLCADAALRTTNMQKAQLKYNDVPWESRTEC